MGWRLLVFYPEHILASMNYFDSDMSKEYKYGSKL